jgi:hypothetical protein
MLLSTVTLAFLMLVPLMTGRSGPIPSASPVKFGESARVCAVSSLPSDIQNQLRSDFGSWTIQRLEMLSEHAKKAWTNKTPSACPGIAVGPFETAQTAYALLLVRADRPDSGYRFVIFSVKPGKSSYDAMTVERSDESGASNFFIRKIKISELFNERSKKQFQVKASDGVLMVDSSENEYETVVYFWSDGHYRHEPVDR